MLVTAARAATGSPADTARASADELVTLLIAMAAEPFLARSLS
jgi:hypothetical protein